MKARAYILIILWTVLLIEPVSANLDIKTVYSSCAEKKTSCSIKPDQTCCSAKTQCGQPNEDDEQEDCEGNRCNPLMSCPTGNFYLSNQSSIAIAALIQSKQKAVLIDDNRIAKQLNECWHPPEII